MVCPTIGYLEVDELGEHAMIDTFRDIRVK